MPLLALAILLVGLAPSEQFDKARLAYERNDYRHVIRLVEPLLYPSIRLSSEAEVAEAHRLLGIAFFKVHEEKSAEREFSILLNSNPDFHLDRLVDGAEVAQFVDGMRRRMEEELRRAKELERQRQEEEQKKKKREDEERRRRAEKIYLEVRVTEHPYFVNFLPLGAGQFQNGQRSKGTALLASEGTLAAASLTLWIVKHEVYPDGRIHTPSQDPDAASALQWARIATGSAFFALWALGVYDSLRHYVPATAKTSPLLPTPAPLSGGAALEWTGRF